MSKRLIRDAAFTLYPRPKLRPSPNRFPRPIKRAASRPFSTCAAAHLGHSSAAGRFPEEAQDVAVVGGGLTGLTTAYYLAKRLPSTRITLYESSDRLGGWVQTDRVPVDVGGVKGLVSFERGPRTLSSLYNDTWRYDDLVLWDLVRDLKLDPKYPKDLPRYIYYPDHLVRVPPKSLFSLIREPLFRQCAKSFIVGALRYYLTDKRSTYPKRDISVGEWLRSVAGGDSTIGNNLVSAMLHGIHGGDIEKLSMSSVFAKLLFFYHRAPSKQKGSRFMLASEESFKNDLQQDPAICKMAKSPKGALVHFGKHGMEALPKALAAALQTKRNVTILRNAPVTQMDFDKKGNKIRITSTGSKEYDRVISTTSSRALVKSTGDALSALSEIEFVSIMTVNIWYPLENLNPAGFGYLIPRSVPPEQNPEAALGVFFDSDVAVRPPDDDSDGEPRGTKLFVLLGGHHYSNNNSSSGGGTKSPPSEEEAVRQAKAVLERHLGIPASTPCHAVARLARDCIPQHNVGHERIVARGEAQLAERFGSRLVVAGGSYCRIGVLGALRNGYAAARIVAGNEIATGLRDAISSNDSVTEVKTDSISCRNLD